MNNKNFSPSEHINISNINNNNNNNKNINNNNRLSISPPNPIFSPIQLTNSNEKIRVSRESLSPTQHSDVSHVKEKKVKKKNSQKKNKLICKVEWSSIRWNY